MASSWSSGLRRAAEETRRRVLDLPGLRAHSSVGSLQAPSVRRHVEHAITIVEPHDVRSHFPHATPTQLDVVYEPRTAYVLRDVVAWSNQSIAMTSGGALIAETAFSESRLQVALRERAFLPLPIKRVDALCTTLDVGRWGNYYHFMVDLLPRLHALRDPRVEALGPVRVFLTRRLHTSLLELLRSWLPEHAELVQLRFPVRLRAARYLWLPYLAGSRSAYLPPDYLARFREHMGRALHAPPTREPDQAILISRKHARSRRLLNEDELLERLAPLGFRTHALESLSLARQAQLFAGARAVVAPHGAGLTNLLHAPEACKVVELFPSEPSPHYRLLATAGRLRYANIGGSAPGKGHDFSVDVTAVMDKLNAL